MKLPVSILKKFVRSASTTRQDEIDCDTCFALLDEFVELELAGQSAEEALPLVQHHLQRCPECKEEFEILRDALRALSMEG